MSTRASTKKRNGLDASNEGEEGPPKKPRVAKDTIHNIVSPDRGIADGQARTPQDETPRADATAAGEEGEDNSTNLNSCTPTPAKGDPPASPRDEDDNNEDTGSNEMPTSEEAKCPSSAASQPIPDAPPSNSLEEDEALALALSRPRRSNRKKPQKKETEDDSNWTQDIVSYTSAIVTWETRFEHLKEYKAKHGHPNPNQKAGTPPDDFKLAVWLAGQRRNFRNKKLPEDKRIQLVELGCEGFNGKNKHKPSKTASSSSQGSKSKDKPDPKEGDKNAATKEIVPSKATKEVKREKHNPGKSSGGAKISWETRFQHLQEFKAKHGHPNPTQGAGTPPSDYKLAVWLSGQRRNFRNHKLPDDKREQLIGLGCNGFEEEDADVKPREISSLADYLGTQEDYHNKLDPEEEGEKSTKAKAEEIIPGSEEDDQDTWDARYAELKIFYRLQGHGNVTISARGLRKGDTTLAVWLNQQRQLFVKGLLSSYRAELLYDLGCSGFDLSDIANHLPSPPKPPKRTKLTPKKKKQKKKSLAPTQVYLPWKIHFKALKNYKLEHGHGPRSNSNSSDAQWLSAWLKLLQGSYQKGMLPNEKAQSLRDLGCVGFGGDDDDSESSEDEYTHTGRYSVTRTVVPWETRFQELEKYEQRHGHANPSILKSSSRAHFRLASWLGEQQGAFRKGTISEAKEKKLRDLGCFGFGNDDGETNDDLGNDAQPIQKRIYFSWKDRLEQLEEYKERNNGNANPPNSKAGSEADGKLGQWLVDQRKKFRQGTLSEDRAQQLHEVGCDGFGGDNATGMVRRRKHPGWYGTFQELQEFKEKHQHANPRRVKTSPEYKLGRWLSDQRQKFRKGHLSLDKAKELRELGCSGFSDVVVDVDVDVDASLSEGSDGELSESSEE